MQQVPTLTFNDGKTMPQLGFGLWQVSDDEAEKASSEALRVGYRSIDSAAIYQNEAGLGRAIKKSGLKSSDLYITTKLWNEDQGRDKTLRAFDASMKKLGLETLDLYLIHWPSQQRGLYVESWKALIELKESGRVRSIGVSNFTPTNLERIIQDTGVVPALNQIELHPRFAQHELVAYHQKHGIITECWSPLGQGQILTEPKLVEIAARNHKTVAQTILRWHLQKGYVAIPKSVTPSRIRENFEVFGFELNDADMKAIDGLDAKDGRTGPNPDTARF